VRVNVEAQAALSRGGPPLVRGIVIAAVPV
jgi:hypothetical protein